MSGVYVDVCNVMAASGVGGWVGGEFLRHNATNLLLI